MIKPINPNALKNSLKFYSNLFLYKCLVFESISIKLFYLK